MSDYLRKYVGKYRVKAEYDQSTNDFPRLENGNLDPSYDDMYIDCKNNIQIKHGGGSMLGCYIPAKQRGVNILRKIYKDNISDKLPSETSKTRTYFDNLTKALVEQDVLLHVEVLDFEVYFEFKSSMIDYIAKLVGAKTSGANISPFSSKNLPKASYKIPEKDMKAYKEAIKDFPTKSVTIKGEKQDIVDGLLVSRVSQQFDKIIIKSQPKGFDINKDRKQKCLKGREYIHAMGKWDEYIEFLKNYKV